MDRENSKPSVCSCKQHLSSWIVAISDAVFTCNWSFSSFSLKLYWYSNMMNANAIAWLHHQRTNQLEISFNCVLIGTPTHIGHFEHGGKKRTFWLYSNPEWPNLLLKYHTCFVFEPEPSPPPLPKARSLTPSQWHTDGKTASHGPSSEAN